MVGSEIEAAVRVEVWQITFRHSLGKLRRHAAKELRDDGVILGWKSGRDGKVHYPPRDQGLDGTWVTLGPGAELLSPVNPAASASATASTSESTPASASTSASASEASNSNSGAGPVLARVRLDGAGYGMFAKLATDRPLASGARLIAEPHGSDLIFRPEQQGEH